MKKPGPYSIGSDHWPGISKLIEEAGEVQQVAGKLLGTGGESSHWDGSDLRERLQEEIGDLVAACFFVMEINGLDEERIRDRHQKKLELFKRWHQIQSVVPDGPSSPMVRGPDGNIKNCALVCGDTEPNCQMCRGTCPDRARIFHNG